MKIHLKFHCFTIFISILIGIAPITTFAQQQTNTEALAAKADAELHAENDIHKITWMGVGLCVPVLSVATGCVAGYTLGSTEGGGGLPGGYGFGEPSIIGMVGGAGLVFCGSSYWVYSHKSAPPAERLVGKSPEYIEHYTTAYQNKMRSQRIKWTLAGPASLFMLRILGPSISVNISGCLSP